MHMADESSQWQHNDHHPSQFHQVTNEADDGSHRASLQKSSSKRDVEEAIEGAHEEDLQDKNVDTEDQEELEAEEEEEKIDGNGEEGEVEGEELASDDDPSCEEKDDDDEDVEEQQSSEQDADEDSEEGEAVEVGQPFQVWGEVSKTASSSSPRSINRSPTHSPSLSPHQPFVHSNNHGHLIAKKNSTHHQHHLQQHLPSHRATTRRGFLKGELPLPRTVLFGVQLEPTLYHFAWYFLMSLHLVNMVFLVAVTAFYFFLANSIEMYTIVGKLRVPASIELFCIALTFGGLAICHLVGISRALYWSLIKRRLTFSGQFHRALRAAHNREQQPTTVSKAIASHSNSLLIKCIRASPWRQKIMSSWLTFLKHHEHFKVDGTMFDFLFLSREAIEILLQTSQAYWLSVFVASDWINHFAVAMIVINCVSTPLIHSIYQSNLAMQRFVSLLSDICLDFCCSVVIPLCIFLPYWNAFHVKTRDFDKALTYDEVWYIKALRENQQVMITSPFDFLSTIFPHLSILFSISSSKRLLHCKRPKPQHADTSAIIEAEGTIAPLPIAKGATASTLLTMMKTAKASKEGSAGNTMSVASTEPEAGDKGKKKLAALVKRVNKTRLVVVPFLLTRKDEKNRGYSTPGNVLVSPFIPEAKRPSIISQKSRPDGRLGTESGSRRTSNRVAQDPSMLIRSSSSPKKRRSLLRIGSFRGRAGKLLQVFFLLWGFAVLGFHLSGRWASNDIPGCKLVTRAWFVQKNACVVLELDCNERNIEGAKEELNQVFQDIEPNVLGSLLLLNCPALAMPSTIQSFTNLLGIEIFNSTLVEWSTEAQITGQKHPLFTFFIMSGTKLPENGHVPPGLISVNDPAPISSIEIIRTRIDQNHFNGLRVDKVWPKLTTLHLEFCELDQMPFVLTQLALEELSLVGNELTSIPWELFTSKNLFILYLSNNPMKQLPEPSTNVPVSRIQILAMENTLLTKLPIWISNEWLDVIKTAHLYAYDTPFCNQMKGQETLKEQLECNTNWNTSKGRTRYYQSDRRKEY